MSDFMNYFDRLHQAMQDRFDAMNREFERAMAAHASDQSATHYSKSVTRSYNGAGNCGEETIVERDSEKGKEVKTVTRRIGDRSIQQTDAKDLKSGQIESTVLRQKLEPADDAAFNEEWAQAEKKYLPAARGLLHDTHEHHHAAAAQLEDHHKAAAAAAAAPRIEEHKKGK